MAETPGPAQRSHQKREAFLSAYATMGNISGACRQAGISRRVHYLWLKKDPGYAKRFSEVEQEAIDYLEQEARRRAMVGTKRPVFHKGEVCGYVQEYSDTLLIFLLKAARPEKYRERYETTIQGGDKPLTFTIQVAHAGADTDL